MNSLALHQYTIIIVNLTGHGLDDVFALKIQIPSDDDYAQSWDNWRHTSCLYHYGNCAQKVSQPLIKLPVITLFYCKTVFKVKGYDGNSYMQDLICNYMTVK